MHTKQNGVINLIVLDTFALITFYRADSARLSHNFVMIDNIIITQYGDIHDAYPQITFQAQA